MSEVADYGFELNEKGAIREFPDEWEYARVARVRDALQQVFKEEGLFVPDGSKGKSPEVIKNLFYARYFGFHEVQVGEEIEITTDKIEKLFEKLKEDTGLVVLAWSKAKKFLNAAKEPGNSLFITPTCYGGIVLTRRFQSKGQLFFEKFTINLEAGSKKLQVKISERPFAYGRVAVSA